MHFLCRADEVGENEARGFDLEGHALLVVRRDGMLHVYVNWCPHLGIELNFQPDEFFDLDNHYLQCANHGALFEVDGGLCVLGPCKGQSLRKVAFSLEDGAVMVSALPARTR